MKIRIDYLVKLSLCAAAMNIGCGAVEVPKDTAAKEAPKASTQDSDGDGILDSEDPDDDNDGILDADDTDTPVVTETETTPEATEEKEKKAMKEDGKKYAGLLEALKTKIDKIKTDIDGEKIEDTHSGYLIRGAHFSKGTRRLFTQYIQIVAVHDSLKKDENIEKTDVLVDGDITNSKATEDTKGLLEHGGLTVQVNDEGFSEVADSGNAIIDTDDFTEIRKKQDTAIAKETATLGKAASAAEFSVDVVYKVLLDTTDMGAITYAHSTASGYPERIYTAYKNRFSFILAGFKKINSTDADAVKLALDTALTGKSSYFEMTSITAKHEFDAWYKFLGTILKEELKIAKDESEGTLNKETKASTGEKPGEKKGQKKSAQPPAKK